MRASFVGVPVDLLTLAETAEIAISAMQAKHRVQHVALNVAKFVSLQKNAVLRRDVMNSNLVGIDGMGIVWAARLLGLKVPERVAGIDLFERLLAECERRELRPYFIGAKAEVLERMIKVINQRHPKLEVAGWRDGYFKPEEEQEIVDSICASKADCLFVAMPTPRKERFLSEWSDALNVPFLMGVGGSFDVISGHVSRAPKWMQQAGLEWFYRFTCEPQRMFWRYASTNAAFAWIIARAIFLNYTTAPAAPTQIP